MALCFHIARPGLCPVPTSALLQASRAGLWSARRLAVMMAVGQHPVRPGKSIIEILLQEHELTAGRLQLHAYLVNIYLVRIRGGGHGYCNATNDRNVLKDYMCYEFVSTAKVCFSSVRLWVYLYVCQRGITLEPFEISS